MAAYTSLIFLIASILSSSFCIAPLHALNIGLDANAGLNLECSKTCESMFCDAPLLLRYGKYCGLLYSGCPEEQPCDGLDACCMRHDQCIDKMGNNYLSKKCNEELQNCVGAFKRSDEPSFQGNTCDVDEVAESIITAMTPAIFAGQILGKH